MEERIIPPSFGWEWIPKTWSLYQKYPLQLTATFFVFYLISAVCLLLPVIGHFVSGMLYPILMLGAFKIFEDADLNRKPQVGDLFSAFSKNDSLKNILPVCLTSAVIMSTAGIITVILSQMMIKFKSDPVAVIPSAMMGVCVLIIIYAVLEMFKLFAPGFIYFRQMPGMKAMNASVVASLRNWRPFLVLTLVMLGLGVLYIVPLMFIGLTQSLLGIKNNIFLVSVGAVEVLALLFIAGPMYFSIPYFMFQEMLSGIKKPELVETHQPSAS